MKTKIIGGIEFEAVRSEGRFGRKFWKVKRVSNGFTFPAGVFDGSSLARLWESMERTFKIVGDRRWVEETIT